MGTIWKRDKWSMEQTNGTFGTQYNQSEDKKKEDILGESKIVDNIPISWNLGNYNKNK